MIFGRAKRKTSGWPRSCSGKRTRGAVSTRHWSGTCVTPGSCSSTWRPAATSGTCRPSCRTRPTDRTTRSTRTWSSVRTAAGRSTRRPRSGTCRCAPIGSGTRPSGCRTKNGENPSVASRRCCQTYYNFNASEPRNKTDKLRLSRRSIGLHRVIRNPSPSPNLKNEPFPSPPPFSRILLRFNYVAVS